MRKSLIWSAAGLLLVGLGLFALLYCPPARFSYCNYQRVQAGMNLEEVQALLGPGTEIERRWVPQEVRPKPGVVVPPPGPNATVRDYPVVEVPVVDGDRFFRWEADAPWLQSGAYIIIAFRDGKVCDKTYWEPSL
jgi:hypothetical protein